MRADILIVGQGLAGTLLAWECERAGIPFEIVDRGHDGAASCAGAGIINPITGRRLVKSWRVDALLPAARVIYRELEAALGVTLWHALRVRRLFADDTERRTFVGKQARGVPSEATSALAPFLGAADDEGFWIEGAARVDVAALLAAARARWHAQGRFSETTIDSVATPARGRHDLVIDCRGLAGARSSEFGIVPWEFSKGELLEVAVAGLAPDVVLNRRHWVLPVREGVAWVGATHEPGNIDSAPSAEARAALEASARTLIGGRFTTTGQRAGVRVNLPDKLPVAGRHPENTALGLANGLGAKGALFAPLLARQWVNHLTEGVPFDAAIDVRRFA